MRLEAHARPVLARLRLGLGAPVDTNDLLDAMYGDRENGGPESASKVLYMVILQLRRIGYPIVNHHGRGYSLPLPCMAPTAPEQDRNTGAELTQVLVSY